MGSSPSRSQQSESPSPATANQSAVCAPKSFEELLQYVRRANGMCERLLRRSNRSVEFHVCPGKQEDLVVPILWKMTVDILIVQRERAPPADAGHSSLTEISLRPNRRSRATYKEISFRQFVRLYPLMQNLDSLRSSDGTSSRESLTASSSSGDEALTFSGEILKEQISNYKRRDKKGTLTRRSKGNREGRVKTELKMSIDKEQRRSEDDDRDTECVICFDRFTDTVLPCTHAFCSQCLKQWMDSHDSCPLCRSNERSQDGDSDWVMLPPSWMGGDRAEYSRMELAGFLQQILESVMDGARNSL